MSAAFSPKTPNETVSLAFDWSKLLSSGETISTETVTASSGTVTGESSDGGVTNFRLSGGTAGQFIKITCRVTTSLGQTLEEAEHIEVREA